MSNQPTAALTLAPESMHWQGLVRHLYLAPRASLPMQEMSELSLIAGVGVKGDRYHLGLEAGHYSHVPEEGRQVTLLEIETLWALKRDHDIELTAAEHRRNVTVEGVPLTHLVGRRFWLGPVLLEGTRLSVPCRYIEELTGKLLFKPLINRAGLNCKIITGGTVRVGAPVKPV